MKTLTPLSRCLSRRKRPLPCSQFSAPSLNASLFSHMLFSSAAPSPPPPPSSSSPSSPPVHLDIHYEPDRQIRYTDALAMQRWKQQELFKTTRVDAPEIVHDALFLFEHPSVYTLGRSSTLDNLRFNFQDEDCVHDLVK